MFNINSTTPRNVPISSKHKVELIYLHISAISNRIRSATSASAQQLPASGSTPSLQQHSTVLPTTAIPTGQFNKNPLARPSFNRSREMTYEAILQELAKEKAFQEVAKREVERHQFFKQMLEDQNSGKVCLLSETLNSFVDARFKP
jgi:hypothetical protein